jgi:hypothetical protein
MTAYRLRDINTGAIAQPPEGLNPNTFKPETGWIIEERRAGEQFKPYRRPTPADLIEKARADIAEVRHWADSAESRLDELEEMI